MFVFACMCVCMCVCVSMHACVCGCVCARACMHACVYMTLWGRCGKGDREERERETVQLGVCLHECVTVCAHYIIIIMHEYNNT